MKQKSNHPFFSSLFLLPSCVWAVGQLAVYRGWVEQDEWWWMKPIENDNNNQQMKQTNKHWEKVKWWNDRWPLFVERFLFSFVVVFRCSRYCEGNKQIRFSIHLEQSKPAVNGKNEKNFHFFFLHLFHFKFYFLQFKGGGLSLFSLLALRNCQFSF